MDQRITIVTLGVADIGRARAFYEALGWRPDIVMESYVSFRLFGMWLALFSRPSLAEEAGVRDAGPGFGGVTLACNVRSKEEVRAVLEEAAAAGACITAAPSDRDWGGYSGYFTDPDGHPWEVAWAPNTTLDAEGRPVFENAGTG